MTRPGEMGRSESQRIAHETAALLKLADNERDYREHVLVTLARLEVKVDGMQDAFDRHTDQDDERFSIHNQRIGENSSWIQKGLGMISLFIVMMGFIFWMIDRMSP